MAGTEIKPFVVERVDGNYILDDELDQRVREAIYGIHWHDFSRENLYERTMSSMWCNLHTLSAAGITVHNDKAWTRPPVHILLDMINAVMVSPVRDALRFMQAVYGDDADTMLRLFAASPVHVAVKPDKVPPKDKNLSAALRGVPKDKREAILVAVAEDRATAVEHDFDWHRQGLHGRRMEAFHPLTVRRGRSAA